MLEREKLEMQQEQMTLKKELAEANQKLVVANESSGQAFTSLPANVTQVNTMYSHLIYFPILAYTLVSNYCAGNV